MTWRAAFVSDVHLGARGAQMERFLAFLAANPCDRLYIVGDLFDGLHAAWLRDLVAVLFAIARSPRVIFVPGNHDAAFRRHCGEFGHLTICRDAVHEASDGRRYLVTHGDEFDPTMRVWGLPTLGAWLKDVGRQVIPLRGMSAAERAINRVVSGAALDRRLAGLCAVGEFAGVITGHFHAPGLREIAPGLTHGDCGDWMRACSAICEADDGSLEVRFAD